MKATPAPMDTMKPMDETKAQALYERMVELQERAKELDEHLRGVQEQLRALETTRGAIKELAALPEAKETWIPIAPGAYVKGTISPAASVLLSVGSQVAVEKSPEAVLQTLTDHEHSLEDVGNQAITELKEVLEEMDTIREQARAVVGGGIDEPEDAPAPTDHKGHSHAGHGHKH